MEIVVPPDGWYAAAAKTAGARADAWRFGIEAGWDGSFSFFECDLCRFAQMRHMPEQEVLDRFYAKYHLSNSYAAKGERKIQRAYRRISSFDRYASGRRFVDIGCNVGFAVEAARRKGFVATGVDVSVEAIDRAREKYPENRFLAGTLSNLIASGEEFDAIFCADVIEHCVDPSSFVRDIREAASPGAVVYLATPDIGHWRAPEPFWLWEEVRPPEHLCWFSKKALRDLLDRNGFRALSTPFRFKPALRMIAVRI